MHELNRISIFNNFLSPELQVEVLKVLRNPGWSLGGYPAIENDSHNTARLWHMNGLQNYPLFSEVIYKIICRMYEIDFKVKRIYANGQLACQKGDIHQDDGDLTFLYYPLQVWRPEWGGNLMFYEGHDVAKCISYRPNRAVAFPARLTHGAEAPSKNYDGLRVSIGFKLVVP